MLIAILNRLEIERYNMVQNAYTSHPLQSTMAAWSRKYVWNVTVNADEIVVDVTII